MYKVLITTSSFGKNDESPLKMMEDAGLSTILNPYGRKLTEEELLQLLLQHKPDFLIAGTEKITKNTLEQSQNFLKLISRCGTGMDSVDLDAAKAIGIPVKNTPDAPTKPVAELTIGVALNLLRKINLSDKSIRESRFEKPMGNLIFGKTVGIIGCGRIGTYTARLFSSFGAEVIGYDPLIRSHEEIKIVSFEETIKNSDIISLHIPYSKSNHHLINDKVIGLMKKNAVLLNISRGGLVDENALIEALKTNKIAGAGIDCFESEPYLGELRELANTILTAHIGSYASEARIEQEITSVKNILETL